MSRARTGAGEVEIRPPREHEREEVAVLLATSLNFDRERSVARAERFPIEDMRIAIVDGRIASVAAEFRFDQWVGGSPLACSAVWGVATLPEHRGRGLASATTGAVLDAARARGATIASLYPATMRPYRRLGFEMAGTFTMHRIAIAAIPSQPDGVPTTELFDLDRDLAGVRACFRRTVSRHTGPVEPIADEHWVTRILLRTDDETRRAVVVREADEITGFLVTGRRHDEAGQLDVAFGLWTEAFVATSEAALRSLLAYVRRFGGLGTSFSWSGPPNDPIGLLLEEQSIVDELQLRWMTRLLDVPAALAARGWPPIDADVVVAVDDARYPGNAGPWRLTLREGVASVEPAPDAGATRPIAIGVLSSMFTGYLRVDDAVALGALDADDPVVLALRSMLAGPDPWSPFFF